MGKYYVTEDQKSTISAYANELNRQARHKKGCPVDPEWMVDALKAIVEGRGFSDFLINGIFLPTDRQVELVKKLNMEHGWGFTEADFKQLGSAPEWPTDSNLAVVVLDISLADVATTFDTAWNLAKAIQPNEWRWDQLLSDPDHLRLLSGKTHQRGLRWQIVDLGANINRKPMDVRNIVTSPASAPLWMAGYSPKWVQAMDGSTVPYIWLPGYEVSIPGFNPSTDVPRLHWDRGDHWVGLFTKNADFCGSDWAVPVVRETPK